MELKIYKKGRPTNLQHICNVCGKEYASSQGLANHKGDAKRGKVKCTPVRTAPVVASQSIGPKSMFDCKLESLLKPIDKGIEIHHIKLLNKKGGKSDFKDRFRKDLTAAVIVA